MTLVANTRGRYGVAMTVLALLGLAVAGYLLTVRLLGEAPVCGPVKGCDTVAASQYATLFGFPVALYGVGYSFLLAGACMVWSWAGERRALYTAYGLGLAGIVAVLYLTYLELFVIEAICIWCVTYGVTIVTGWILAAIAAWRTAER
jgi:uncharacterized membrane protein